MKKMLLPMGIIILTVLFITPLFAQIIPEGIPKLIRYSGKLTMPVPKVEKPKPKPKPAFNPYKEGEFMLRPLRKIAVASPLIPRIWISPAAPPESP